MSSGITHTITIIGLCISLIVGGVLIDLDHLKTHSIKQLINAFKGEKYVHNERHDEQHVLHKTTIYNKILYVYMMLTMFVIGMTIHLKMDGVI